MGSIAVVVGGGPLAPVDETFDEVIAADSGLDRALDAGLRVDVLIGDLDSISDEGVRWARTRDVPIEHHLADKDDTDTALALRYAAGRSHRRLVLLGGESTDRLDHQLGTIVALGAPDLAELDEVMARLGGSTVHVLHPGRSIDLDLPTGSVFSLLALHGECTGVSVQGAKWPLHDATLRSGSTLGISNEITAPPVHIGVRNGVLTVVRPSGEDASTDQATEGRS